MRNTCVWPDAFPIKLRFTDVTSWLELSTPGLRAAYYRFRTFGGLVLHWRSLLCYMGVCPLHCHIYLRECVCSWTEIRDVAPNLQAIILCNVSGSFPQKHSS